MTQRLPFSVKIFPLGLRLLALCLLLLPALPARSQPKDMYESLHRLTRTMKVKEVMGLADRLSRRGSTDSAMVAYTIVMNRFSRSMPVAEKVMCVHAHQRASEYWLNRGANLNALQVLMGAREISESIPADSLTVEILNNMAYVYMTFKHYERAVQLFEQSYALQHGKGNPDAEFRLLNNLASVHILLGDSRKAREELERMKRLSPREKEVKEVAPFHMALLAGALNNAAGNYRKGAACVKSAVEYARSTPYAEMLECLAMEDLVNSYEGLGERDSLYSALLRYDALSARCGLPDKRIDALRGLSLYCEKAGRMPEALRYKHEYLTLADSVMNYREFARLNNIEFVYSTDKYKQEIASLSEDAEMKARRIHRQVWVIILLTALMLLIGSLLLVIYRQKRRLRQSYRDLYRIHEASVSHESFHEERRKELEGRIRELEKELAGEAPSEEAREKYSCSRLKGDGERELGEKLRELLSDPAVYCDPELNIVRLAELAGTNSKYVSQAVNVTFGMNFASQLNARRIAEARKRLSDPASRHLTIAAIASQVGYRNQTTFIGAFKKAVGMTPSMYMKLAREEQSQQAQEL